MPAPSPTTTRVCGKLASPSPPGLQERDRPGNGRRGEIARHLARFVVVGVASTLAFVVLYLLLRQATSRLTAFAATAADAVPPADVDPGRSLR